MFDLFIEISIPIFFIFLFILAVIFIARLVLNLTLFFLIRKYKNFKQKRQEDKEKYKKGNLPTEDELLKSQKKEKDQLLNVERINLVEQDFKDKERGKSRVVDVVKPIGFWTSLILGQKLSLMVNEASAINSREHEGFWVSIIEAQSRGVGRKKGRRL